MEKKSIRASLLQLLFNQIPLCYGCDEGVSMEEIKWFESAENCPRSFRDSKEFKGVINSSLHAKFIPSKQKNPEAQKKSIETTTNTWFNNYYKILTEYFLDDPIQQRELMTQYYYSRKNWVTQFKHNSNKFTTALDGTHKVFTDPDFKIEELYFVENTPEERKKYTFNKKKR